MWMKPTHLVLAFVAVAGCAKHHHAKSHAPVAEPTAESKPVPATNATTAPAAAAGYPYATEIAAFEAEDAAHPMPKDAIIFYGSSSIVKWTTLKQDFPNLPVVNRGFGGSNMAQAAHYVERVVIPNKPKTVVLYEGDNDLQDAKTPQQIIDSLREIVGKIHGALPQTKIYVLAIKPSPSRFTLLDKQNQTNAMIKAMADADDKLDYIDVATPMIGADGHPKQELFGPDDLHMAPAGYALWTSIVKPVLEGK